MSDLNWDLIARDPGCNEMFDNIRAHVRKTSDAGTNGEDDGPTSGTAQTPDADPR